MVLSRLLRAHLGSGDRYGELGDRGRRHDQKSVQHARKIREWRIQAIQQRVTVHYYLFTLTALIKLFCSS